MSSVSSTNATLANLLQTLSKSVSPLVSTPATLAALEKAPAADIVKLSAAATQLASIATLFRGTDSSTTNSNLFSAILGTTGTDSTSSQLQNMETLFGVPNNANVNNGLTTLESLFNRGTSASSTTSLLNIIA